jgi:hypothetical protein
VVLVGYTIYYVPNYDVAEFCGDAGMDVVQASTVIDLDGSVYAIIDVWIKSVGLDVGLGSLLVVLY